MVIIYVQFAVTNDLALVHLEQTYLETVFGSTQLEFTVHQWWLCHISDHIGLALSSTDLYLFNFVFRSWPSDTRVWLMHCFLTQALLYHLLSRLYQRRYYSNFTPNFTGIRVTFIVSSLQHVKWLLLTICILGVLLTLAMLLMPLLWCSCRYKHLVSTLVAHQMVVNATTAQLHLSRKSGTPLHLLAVPLKHGLISTSVEKTMLLPQRSLLKIVLFSSWNVVTNIYRKIWQEQQEIAHIKNSGRSIGSK